MAMATQLRAFEKERTLSMRSRQPLWYDSDDAREHVLVVASWEQERSQTEQKLQVQMF